MKRKVEYIQQEPQGFMLVIREFSCPHWKILATGESRWCYQCSIEREDSNGIMKSKARAILSIRLDENGEVEVLRTL